MAKREKNRGRALTVFGEPLVPTLGPLRCFRTRDNAAFEAQVFKAETDWAGWVIVATTVIRGRGRTAHSAARRLEQEAIGEARAILDAAEAAGLVDDD